MNSCVRCDHPSPAHAKGGAPGARCRIGGCPCPGFDDGAARPARPHSRRVAIDVPDGYVLNVQLIPAARAVLHAGEMILPPDQAEKVRDAEQADQG